MQLKLSPTSRKTALAMPAEPADIPPPPFINLRGEYAADVIYTASSSLGIDVVDFNGSQWIRHHYGTSRLPAPGKSDAWVLCSHQGRSMANYPLSAEKLAPKLQGRIIDKLESKFAIFAIEYLTDLKQEFDKQLPGVIAQVDADVAKQVAAHKKQRKTDEN